MCVAAAPRQLCNISPRRGAKRRLAPYSSKSAMEAIQESIDLHGTRYSKASRRKTQREREQSNRAVKELV